MTTIAERTVTVADLVAAARRQQRSTPALDGVGGPRQLAARVDVRVVAAHAGAGASVVAVAMADALAARGEVGVTLLDLAPAQTSGLVAAAECEIESGYRGWRGGRRGASRILRPSSSVDPADLTLPLGIRGKTIADGDWSCVGSSAERVVMVCRGTVPGVRRAEAALGGCGAEVVVAVVGARRWPKVVAASLGPRLSAVATDGRVVLIPANDQVEIYGVDVGATPLPVLNAAARLVELIWPDLARPTTPHRMKGQRR
jgi:hypothetical protein